MRTASIVVLVLLLGLSAVMNVGQWRRLRHERDVRTQEVDYVKAFAARKFTVAPEYGMVFYKNREQQKKGETSETLEIHLGGVGGGSGKPGEENYGWHQHGISHAGLVDTSRMSPVVPGGATWPPAYDAERYSSLVVLCRILGQVRIQDAGWLEFGTGDVFEGGAMGYLMHPAGILTVVVRPVAKWPNIEVIQYTWQFASGPARDGVVNSCDAIPAAPKVQFFQPE